MLGTTDYKIAVFNTFAVGSTKPISLGDKMAEPGAPLNLDPAFLAENRAEVLQRIAISLAVITTAMMALRFYAKVRFQSPGIELFDIFLIAAYIITLGMCALGISEPFFSSCPTSVCMLRPRGAPPQSQIRRKKKKRSQKELTRDSSGRQR